MKQKLQQRVPKPVALFAASAIDRSLTLYISRTRHRFLSVASCIVRSRSFFISACRTVVYCVFGRFFGSGLSSRIIAAIPGDTYGILPRRNQRTYHQEIQESFTAQFHQKSYAPFLIHIYHQRTCLIRFITVSSLHIIVYPAPVDCVVNTSKSLIHRAFFNFYLIKHANGYMPSKFVQILIMCHFKLSWWGSIYYWGRDHLVRIDKLSQRIKRPRNRGAFSIMLFHYIPMITSDMPFRISSMTVCMLFHPHPSSPFACMAKSTMLYI